MAVNKNSTTRRLLEYGVEEIIERESIENKLRSGRRLTVKLGADPSAPDLHLGHAVVLYKLAEFQKLGHRVVFIIGDFTALIGDPSGRKEVRKPLTQKEIKKNAETYFKQVGAILDLKKTEIRYNSEWLSKLALADFIKVAGRFSLRRLMDREDFQKRIRAGQEIGLHEALYQVLQAYDSLAIGADVELGGRDQKLNLLAGRELQKKMGKAEQDLVITPLLIGLDGKQKMSKSLGNYIGLRDSAADIYGKIMSVPDALILHYAELAAQILPVELDWLKNQVKNSPYQAKQFVARRTVELHRGKLEAGKAENIFVSRFRKRAEGSAAFENKPISKGVYTILDLVIKLGGIRSRSQARRLILGGAVECDHKAVYDPKTKIDLRGEVLLRVGKKGFFRLITNSYR